MGYFKELNIIELQSIEEQNCEIQSKQQALEFVFGGETVKPNSDLDNLVILADFIQSNSQHLKLVSAN